MEGSQQSQSASSYATRLDRTLRALQKRVREQEALLQQLRSSTTPIATEPSTDPNAHLEQLCALKLAYESIIPAEPWLPSSESPLPALLALRNTDACIRETRDCIANTESDLEKTTARLEKEKADLEDSKLIQAVIQKRTIILQDVIKEQTQRSPEQMAKEMIREATQKKKFYDVETGKLVGAFNEFIDEHLAVMLAAEELGGPVVGEDLELNEESLEAGFSAKRATKKLRTNPNEDKRQRRIDEIWGPRPGAGNERADQPWNEKRAAATEMRELTEQLLNSLVEAGGNGSGAYVDLQRESAAVRFLVRSGVAQFHPRDGGKLRLIDFGGELDD